MITIKKIIVKDMKRITLLMMILILFLTSAIQVFSLQRTNTQNARQIFRQVGQILAENSLELEKAQEEYTTTCLNNARTIAYILKYNPEAWDDVEELKKIAAGVEVDEIHIFNTDGVIISGTHPEYFNLSFDSGEQMAYFKPMLEDRTMELVQDIMPNTSEGKLVQYSALWSEDKTFIVQVGMYPDTVLRVTEKNELSYIFSLLRTGIGYSLYAIDPDTETIVGTTIVSDLNKTIAEVGFRKEQLKPEGAFWTKINQSLSYCQSTKIGENYIIWATPVSGLAKTIISSEFFLLAGLLLISLFLVTSVEKAMNKTVIHPISVINNNLRAIQNGDLNTKVNVRNSREFSDLSAHINSMVCGLLQSSEKLELSEKIRLQKEELEKQHIQLKAALERAEEASKAKSEFLFNMSHDIRTPMNAIIGLTNLALESDDLAEQKAYLKNIAISSRHLLDLLNNILELSSIEHHDIQIEEELINIEETCRNLSIISGNDLKKKNLSYTVDMEITHPFMYVDKLHYSQIFMNIISNAVKYTPEGGTIAVSFRELPGDSNDSCFVETVVKDNGIGMSAEFLSHVYESFSRERNSTASGIPGSGLGLSIVKNLVNLMGGTIHIASQQGIGTSVTICFPHRIGEPASPEQDEPAEDWDPELFRGRHILLAEDIDINAIVTSKMLSVNGCVIERAKDGAECVEMLKKAPEGYYDLILMDIQMPNMDGYQATQAIRALENKQKASLPILAVTANAFQEDIEKAAESGMNGHIAKPLDKARLLRAVAEVLQDRDKCKGSMESCSPKCEAS